MTLYDVLALLLSIVAVACVVQPFFSTVSAERPEQDVGARQRDDAKRRCLQMLKDLELEYTLGNMQEDDFHDSKRRIEKELAHYL